MNKIYDNGSMILGNVYNVKEYVCRHSEETWEIEELIKDLEDLDETDIVVVNYDLPMGYTIDFWKEKDLVKESE